MGTGCIHSCPWTALCYDPAQGGSPSPSPCPPQVPNPIQPSPHWCWGLRSGMSRSSQVSQLGVILSRPPVPPGYLGHLETFSVTSMRKGCRGHRVGRAWGAQGPVHRTSGPHTRSARASRPALQAPLTRVLLPPRVCGRGPLSHRAQASKLAVTPAWVTLAVH